jgi:hypothetical protein
MMTMAEGRVVYARDRFDHMDELVVTLETNTALKRIVSRTGGYLIYMIKAVHNYMLVYVPLLFIISFFVVYFINKFYFLYKQLEVVSRSYPQSILFATHTRFN